MRPGNKDYSAYQRLINEYKDGLLKIAEAVKKRCGESSYYRSNSPLGREFWNEEEKKWEENILRRIRLMEGGANIPQGKRLSAWSIG